MYYIIFMYKTEKGNNLMHFRIYIVEKWVKEKERNVVIKYLNEM